MKTPKGRVRVTALGTIVCVALLTLSAPRSTGATPASPAAWPASQTLVQELTVSWSGGMRGARTRARVVVPGIGQATVICRRNDTRIVLRPYDRTAETQMWSAKYETKRGGPVVAVKNARVYTHAHAADLVGSGTGRTTHEGLNQRTPVEASSSGHLHGIISSRPGRHTAAAAAGTPAATSFALHWNWSGMRNAKRAACHITGRFATSVAGQQGAARRLVRETRRALRQARPVRRQVLNRAEILPAESVSVNLNWHGDAEAALNGTARGAGRLGTLRVDCAPGRDGEATLTVNPYAKNTWLWVEQITGEGDVDDHVETTSLAVDPATARLGPVDLPGNGMLRLYLSRGNDREAFIVSSLRITNNAEHPDQNLCETAVAPWID